MEGPKIILLFSGKRKSGKDFLCEKLRAFLGEDKCTLIRISGPLKKLYAQHHDLDFQELLSDGPYKEQYRVAMINWSDEIRAKDPGYFCRAACEMAKIRPVWIVSDVRRVTDLKWFKDTYQDKIKTVRISADSSVRERRGWIFTQGVDDTDSECNLDHITNWDVEVINNDEESLEEGIKDIMGLVKSHC